MNVEIDEVNIDFDDSIIRISNQRDRPDKGCCYGAMQLWEYRMKWYGEDEATAKAMD